MGNEMQGRQASPAPHARGGTLCPKVNLKRPSALGPKRQLCGAASYNNVFDHRFLRPCALQHHDARVAQTSTRSPASRHVEASFLYLRSLKPLSSEEELIPPLPRTHGLNPSKRSETCVPSSPRSCFDHPCRVCQHRQRSLSLVLDCFGI